MNSFETDKDFWMVVREVCLSLVNIIEVKLSIFPTTSDIRRRYKSDKRSFPPEPMT